MSYQPLPPLGQAAMSASLPVVIASDQASIPVAATLAAETTKVIGTVNIAAGQSIAVTGTFWQATQPISGTVTANLSATDNQVLDDISTNTGTIAGDTTSIDAKIPALGQALAAASVPVVLTAAQLSTLTPPAAITGFATETTLGTRLSESDFDTKIGALTEAAPATDTASSGLNGRLQRIAQRITSLIALIPASLGQKAMSASFAVTLASDQSTLPVSLASVPSHAVTNAGVFVVQENGAALTALQLIDDVVHANDAAIGKTAAIGGQFDDTTPGTTTENSVRALRMSTRRELYVQLRDAAGNERGLNIAADGSLAITVASLPSHAVTNAGVFAVQSTLQAGTAYVGKVRLTDGTTDTDIRDLANSNALNVAIVDGSGDQITSFGGGTQYTEGDTDASIAGTAMMWEDTSDTLRAVSAAKPLPVNVISGSAAGTEYTEDSAAPANPAGGALMLVREDARAGGLTTTDNDMVALRGNNKGEAYVKDTDAGASLATLAGAVSGTEMQVDVLTIPALVAGTAAIGKLLPPDIDITGHTNYAKKYYTNAGAVTDGIIWSPAAGKRWHVVSLFIQVSAAATVTIEDDLAAGDSPVMKMELAANSGIIIPFPEKYPLASGEDAADLLITTSAGNVYVTAVGYEI